MIHSSKSSGIKLEVFGVPVNTNSNHRMPPKNLSELNVNTSSKNKPTKNIN